MLACKETLSERFPSVLLEDPSPLMVDSSMVFCPDMADLLDLLVDTLVDTEVITWEDMAMATQDPLVDMLVDPLVDILADTTATSADMVDTMGIQ